jgi:hypothetical protein
MSLIMEEVDGSKSVPTDLLELFVVLDEFCVTPNEFKSAFGDAKGVDGNDDDNS